MTILVSKQGVILFDFIGQQFGVGAEHAIEGTLEEVVKRQSGSVQKKYIEIEMVHKK
jgi:hypothetical protein